MGSVTRNGRKVHYYVENKKGRPIVFLHGFCENARIWEYINKDMPFQTISLDFPGFGNSDMQSDVSISRLAQNVRAVIESLDLQNPILIGHSLGGYVALAYANEFSEETAAVGLLNSHPFADNAKRIRERNKSIRFIRDHGASKYIPQLYDGLFYSNKSFLKNTKKHLIDQHIDIDEDILISYLMAMRDRRGRTSFLSNWEKPFLFLLGKHDKLISWEKQLSQASLAPVSELVVMKKSGHMVQFEERIKTREAILDFVEFVETME